MAPFMPSNVDMKYMQKTQSSRYIDSITIKVVFLDNKAYWIKDNTFYVADVRNHQIQHETATKVDTMSMDRVQLDKIILVVEKLTKGEANDNRNSW